MEKYTTSYRRIAKCALVFAHIREKSSFLRTERIKKEKQREREEKKERDRKKETEGDEEKTRERKKDRMRRP